MTGPIGKLLYHTDKRVAQLASLIQETERAIQERTITQLECDELLHNIEVANSLIQDAINLQLKSDINKCISSLYTTVTTVKSLLP